MPHVFQKGKKDFTWITTTSKSIASFLEVNTLNGRGVTNMHLSCPLHFHMIGWYYMVHMDTHVVIVHHSDRVYLILFISPNLHKHYRMGLLFSNEWILFRNKYFWAKRFSRHNYWIFAYHLQKLDHRKMGMVTSWSTHT